MKKLAVLLAAGAVTVAVGLPAAEANTRHFVQIRGGVVFDPGNFIKDDQHFAQRDITVSRGDTVTWQDRSTTQDGHTITLVKASDLPRTLDEINACYGPGGICGITLARHDPDGDQQPPFHLFVNNGRAGFDVRGDSRLLVDHTSISADITAPTGSTLHYMCTIHPWMQATVHVR